MSTRVRFAPIGLAAVALMAGIAGCPQGPNVAQQIAACSGNVTGTFTGTVSGTVSGTLSGDGTLLLTFTPTDPTVLGVATFSFTVTSITTVSFEAVNANDISATFNFDNCTLSGSWTFGSGSGSWSISKS